MTDIASSIGLHQLRKADRMHRQRSHWAEYYTHRLQDVEELILPTQMPNRIHSWHLYVIRLKLDKLRINRSDCISELKRRGICTSVHWMPLHMHPYYREKYGYQPEDLPQTAGMYQEIISLPLFSDLTEQEVNYITNTLKEVIGRNLKSQA